MKWWLAWLFDKVYRRSPYSFAEWKEQIDLCGICWDDVKPWAEWRGGRP